MKNLFILGVLFLALTPAPQAQGVTEEPRPYRVWLQPPFDYIAVRNYALEWRPVYRFSLAYMERFPFYRNIDVPCHGATNCPDQYHLVNDKGAQNLELRYWFYNYFYIALGSMKAKGLTQEIFRQGDGYTVGWRDVYGGSFSYQSTVPAAVTPSVGAGAQYASKDGGFVFWVGMTRSTQLRHGDRTSSSTNPKVTQADINGEIRKHQDVSINSRVLFALLTVGYAF